MKPGKAKAALQFHPLSELLPAMTEPEFAALKNSIAVSSQTDPIILLDGKILDGRHRYRACQELGKEPIVRNYDKAWGDPINYIYAKAVHRNLTDSQKAAAAVKLKIELTKRGKDKRLLNLKQNGDRPWPLETELKILNGTYAGTVVTVYDYTASQVVLKTRIAHAPQMKIDLDAARYHLAPTKPTSTNGDSRDRAGDLFGVSGRYVQDAELLYRKAPKLFKQVFAGELPITRAKSEYARHHRQRQLHAKAQAAGPVNVKSLQIHEGDCLKGTPKLPWKCARLIFCDSPYNIGIDYGDGEKADLLPPEKFLYWCGCWMREAHRLLTDDGSFWVLICDEYAADFVLYLKDTGFTIRNWIKWYETFGVNCANRFNRTSRHLFYCTKSESNFVFHPEAVNRPSDRQAKYGDKRAAPAGKIHDDVWIIPRLVDNAKESMPGRQTQLPLELMRRVIECASDPGDTVMDFFVGSGTTPHQCLLSGRKFIGFEKNKERAGLARLRVQAAAAELSRSNK